MKILLVDDHLLFADGMRSLLEAGGFTVVGTAGDAGSTLPAVRRHQPDLVLMDINLPDGDGITLTALIKAEFPAIRIVMLTMKDDDGLLLQAMKSGASGYLLKNINADRLFVCLEQVARGEAVFSPEIAGRMLQEYRAPQPDGLLPGPLTPRQEEVLAQIARGLSHKDVAQVLEISERTVKYHLKEILERLQLDNRSQAISYFARTYPAG